MRALSTGKDEKAKGDYPLMISNALLTTQVLVKSCGSVIQCVEKISNLQ
ncbi:type III secretion system rspB [Pseudomonas tolaasii]|uniref:Type III secretion system rspB n=2 Tax=Pseudomonas tolaasii TaxID=29442 RepID=A0A7Y8AM04_PSETO|nr:type III secretion system rspB [Pseudomonas tolaasii]MBW1247411.1 type III secretion system rspB [Pseudomonas tolaasii]MBW4794576.1 type III secretion system rspB [Pseudomonas tolaasii]MBY8940813.1 type III secretion system rspB [Pseudomonas tolaasii]NWC21880.1 type III secretion system rspB [Pseudomonas tolaasii]